MKLKTFKAPDLAQALARARAELGPDALVLATNEIRGRMGLSSVEITVGVDRPFDGAATGDLKRLAREVQRSRDREDSRAASATSRAAAGARRPGASRSAMSVAVDALVRSGLSRDLATRFERIASRNLGPRGDASQVAAAAEKGLAALVPFVPAPLRAKVLFLVGPSGAGKTTTAAKLAARAVLDPSRSVVFGHADFERIGSAEQTRIYARHIGARFAAIDAPADLARAVDSAGRSGLVVIDTAGIGASDVERLDRLGALRHGVPDADVALLIPSGLHREEARRVLQRFAPLRPTCAGFAKVDDGGRLGDLVTALAATALPLSFVTNGHRVPDDLEQASPRLLAAMLLRSGFGRDVQREIQR